MNKLLHPCLVTFGLIGLLTLGTVRAATPFPTDSVGIEKRDGKRLIIHHVDQGETLFSIARRYHSSADAIRDVNPGLKDALQYGQVVRVPLDDSNLSRRERKALDKSIREAEKAKEATAEATKETKPTESKAVEKDEKTAVSPPKATKKAEPANSGIHVVEAGQTLYSLAVRYGVLQSSLRKWNNLTSDNILVGQALIVSERAYYSRQPAKTEPVKNEPPKAEPVKTAPKPIKSSPPKADKSTATVTPEHDDTNASTASASVADTPAEEPKVIRPGDTAPLPATGKRVSDIGLAEAIEGSENSGKYLALHRSAPIGTLVQVRNDVSNQSIWVKVVGRLPDTGINDRVLVKLSARAFAKLSPVDRRFRAEVSYIVP